MTWDEAEQAATNGEECVLCSACEILRAQNSAQKLHYGAESDKSCTVSESEQIHAEFGNLALKILGLFGRFVHNGKLSA